MQTTLNLHLNLCTPLIRLLGSVAAAQEEEEEGWTLVTSKKGKNKSQSASGVVVPSVSRGKATAIGAKEATKVR
eukprot:1196279-Prorocentrum_minimum.AAC.6